MAFVEGVGLSVGGGRSLAAPARPVRKVRLAVEDGDPSGGVTVRPIDRDGPDRMTPAGRFRIR